MHFKNGSGDIGVEIPTFPSLLCTALPRTLKRHVPSVGRATVRTSSPEDMAVLYAAERPDRFVTRQQ
jgi:hypothetical protein